MKFAAHAALEGGVDHLMLLHSVFAFEGGGDYICRIMIAITRQILDLHHSTGDAFADEAFNIWSSHGHGDGFPL